MRAKSLPHHAVLAATLTLTALAMAEKPIRFQPTVLGSLTGGSTQGLALSAAGLATGQSGNLQTGDVHAFLDDGTGIQNIDTFGMDHSYGSAINAAGTVAGVMGIQSGSQTFNFPFRHTAERGMELVACFNGTQGNVAGVNANGDIAGSWALSDDTTYHGYFVTSENTLHDLGTLGGAYSYATGVNDNRQVCGYSASTSDTQAFRWEDGFMMPLGTLGGSFSVGNAINAAGQVTGTSSSSEGWQHAFRYSDGAGMEDLQTLEDILMSQGQFINERGDVAGWYLPQTCMQRTFIYTDQTGMLDIGAIEDGMLTPNGLNNRGQIVGQAIRGDNWQQSAFLWSAATGLVDVNDVLTSPLGFRLVEALAINDAGQILARGTDAQGKAKAVLLTPKLPGTSSNASHRGAAGKAGAPVAP
ncbi:MAG: hypothetical protein CHACPFDD_01130 [Phycisphaerae bacterium]|nr:hypothetical protein [Phycisphaerae bacterium]